eukprot:747232-Hanusia_phi.AAC.7
MFLPLPSIPATRAEVFHYPPTLTSPGILPHPCNIPPPTSLQCICTLPLKAASMYHPFLNPSKSSCYPCTQNPVGQGTHERTGPGWKFAWGWGGGSVRSSQKWVGVMTGVKNEGTQTVGILFVVLVISSGCDPVPLQISEASQWVRGQGVLEQEDRGIWNGWVLSCVGDRGNTPQGWRNGRRNKEGS